MQNRLSLSPRYFLDDESPWLVGIDPVRRYWIRVNGDSSRTIAVPGLSIASLDEFKKAVLSFRSLEIGAILALPTFTTEPLVIQHLADNLYAISHPVEGASTWHLFDRETVESFLLAAHPDWKSSQQDISLGRDLILQSWHQPSAEKHICTDITGFQDGRNSSSSSKDAKRSTRTD
ncbi:MAG: hypothetical protein AB4040_21690 [Synechococcus sp.]